MASHALGTSVPASAQSELVTIHAGKPATTSTIVAAKFSKRHDTVLRAIRNLECSDEFRLRNFAETVTERKNPSGGNAIKSPEYIITRDGFSFLAMGFTGKEAAKWKEQYINAFNLMESELARIGNESRAYTVNPSDTLTADQAEKLRSMVRHACLNLPKPQQAAFSVKAWSKLKSHFGVSYRQIPQREFQEAVSLVARHVSDWKLLDAPTKEETMEPTPGDLTNPAYYRDCKEQLYKFIDRVAPSAKWPDDEATAQKIADGYLADILTSRRWIASFDHRGQLQLSPLPFDAMMVTESALPECIEDPTITSADTVLSVLEACAARLQRRQERKS